ncbi:hypothetical protein O0I10_006043 [Lichtheimia ornata]|uniref:Uncharacterized protein n=1 Tax=Lichtheimia ornata TaxID=688661 RepID=A0AAD7XZA5_9FUNG|nr:uncharacterized protein O0I10_006043 [Lichtheimia ornata]KAJ8658358.1 hypothetical protein O0I10_006043 [Lichtheimia ornata]
MSQEAVTSPPRPPRPPQQQRTMTLGPSAPIHDWEVEKVTLIQECKDYRERAEGLEKTIQQDRATYERNTSSLLREVKMKESLLEKRVQDVERQLMEQIQDLQRQMVAQQQEHEDAMQEQKTRYEQTLAAEQKKHERRLGAMQDRLREATTQQQQQQQDVVEPQSATSEHHHNHHHHDELQSLRQELARERSLRAQEKREWQLRLEYQSKSGTSSSSNTVTSPTTPSSAVETSELQRLRELFFKESQHQAMQHEARVENLRSEYEDLLKEANNQLETERAVWRIEQQSAVEEAARVEREKMEANMEQERNEWRNKLLDAETSMSKDATAIQAHWQTKVNEAENSKQTELERLKGEMEVVKDRLGKEIQRRKQMQAKLAVAQENEQRLSKRKDRQLALERQLDSIQSDYQRAYHLAQNLLAMISNYQLKEEEEEDDEPLLADLLLRSLHACQATTPSPPSPFMDHTTTFLF